MFFPLGMKGKIYQIPYVSLTILAVNILFFIPRYVMTHDAYWQSVRVSCSIPFLNMVMNGYFHADWGHIFYNMIFFFTFAPLLEKELGGKKFFTFYTLSGFFATFVEFMVMYPNGGFIGASGAIFGLMGAGLIRFNSRKISVLPWYKLIFPFKFQIPAYVFVLTYAYMDYTNGIRMLKENFTNVAHWAHIGGLVFGVAVGIIFKFYQKGKNEKNIEDLHAALERNENHPFLEELARKVLAANPHNIEAMHTLAKINTKFRPTPEGEQWYRKAILTLFVNDPIAAAQMYEEYLFAYGGTFPLEMQRSFARDLAAGGKHHNAAHTLEVWLEKNAFNANRSTMYMDVAHIYFKYLGNSEMAKVMLEKLIEEAPGTAWETKARERIEQYSNATPKQADCKKVGYIPLNLKLAQITSMVK